MSSDRSTDSDWKKELSKANMMPPFFCCHRTKVWSRNHSWKADEATFRKFLREGPLSFHFHRHNLNRIRPKANIEEAFYVGLFVQKPRTVHHTGNKTDEALLWESEWTDFYIRSEESEGHARANKVHSCNDNGLVLVDYKNMIEGEFGKTGLSMDVHCNKHSYFWHIMKLGRCGPDNDYVPMVFESSSDEQETSTSTEPVSCFSSSSSSTSDTSDDDSLDDEYLYMATPAKKDPDSHGGTPDVEIDVSVEDEESWLGTQKNTSTTTKAPIHTSSCGGVHIYNLPDVNGNMVY